MRLSFRFFDYDNNGSIGSVDIQNLVKHLDQAKLDLIMGKYSQIRDNKAKLSLAKKMGKTI